MGLEPEFDCVTAKVCIRFKTHASASFHEGCEKSFNTELDYSSPAQNIGHYTTFLKDCCNTEHRIEQISYIFWTTAGFLMPFCALMENILTSATGIHT